jgi:hypothetical protein
MAISRSVTAPEEKPRIFIGSSTEGLAVAEQVKECLSHLADCYIWNEREIFATNQSYFDSLLKIINRFDYGVLVATGDDFTTSRNTVFSSPRDNVVFEFGMFLGRLGKNKVFLVREEDSKLPSDLLGISLPSFPKQDEVARVAAVADACDGIISELRARAGTYEIGLLPSLPLAYGYFANFVDHTATKLYRKIGRRMRVRLKGAGGEFTDHRLSLGDFKLSILIPDELKRDVKRDVEAARFGERWTVIEFDTGQARPYILYVDPTTIDGDVLHLFDIPTTLNALAKTLQMYERSEHIGKNEAERLLERRELASFRRVLDHEIQDDALLRKRVFTEKVDI